MARRRVESSPSSEAEAAAPTEQALRRLACFRSREGVLSVYLGFDPAGGERRDARAAFFDAFKPLEKLPLSAAQQARLEEEKVLVQEFVHGPFALHGRSVIMFSCRPRKLWQVFQLQVPVRPMARFAERPAVAQLAGILDEYERYAVVLIDHRAPASEAPSVALSRAKAPPRQPLDRQGSPRRVVRRQFAGAS
jgi:hypothetical protein